VTAALYDTIARIARHEAAARSFGAVGKVTEIFPADQGKVDHAVSVELRDSRVLLPRVPVAVGVLGFAAIPAVGDLVVVMFLDGDVNAPVVIGRIYHAELDPPEHADGQIILSLPPGDDPKVKIEITPSTPLVQVTLPGDVSLTCTEDRAEIRAGEIRVQVDGTGGGRAEIKAGGSTITIKKDGDITLRTNGTFKVDAAVVDISGSAKVKIAASAVEIN
jgi:uncharacterized protein involved in type VI secretion and phage assembly